MNYIRVLPRDLFNEAKLLKCVGRLVLLIEDRLAPLGLQYDHDGEAFWIDLLEEGSLTISNVRFRVGEQFLLFKTTYNSKAPWPLFLQHDLVDYPVFDDEGELDVDFIHFIMQLK